MDAKRLNPKLIDLIKRMLQPEATRIPIPGIMKHPWMNMSLTGQKMNINFERIRNFSQLSNVLIVTGSSEC